jgi:hypothetical protein
MTDEDKAAANKVFGELKFLLRVAAPDATTVVITFGGTQAMLAETIKTAKDGGAILKSEGIEAGMKYMPKPAQSLTLINVANLWDVMTKAAATMGAASEVPPFNITAKAPIMVGSSIVGTSANVTIYIPTALVQDVVKAAAQWMASSMFGGGSENKPAKKGSDF